jgi:hypothetical protein
MSENFETLYEKSILEYTENPTFVNSALKGAMYDDFKLPLPEQNNFSEDYYSTLNIGTPVSKNSSDTISFSTSNVANSFGSNHFTFNPSSTFNLKMTEDTNINGFWKYNEDKILKQLEQYISGTYSQHYVDRTGGGTEQTLDKIKHNRREGFCAGNVTKYIDRYDTKGTPRADLFKVLHYTILLINHLNLIENK